MSNSSEKANALLQIRTEDAAAEIFVVNEKLDIVQRGLGERLDAQLPLGIYKAKVRSGSQIEERLVVLSEAGGSVLQKFSQVHFASAAPLNNTSLTHEFHIANAEVESRKIHQRIGGGSMIYLFVRDWTTKQRPNAEPDSQNPARGLTLHNQDGAMLIDFEQESAKEGGWDPWAACNIELDAGNYRLRLEIADGTQIEQTIVASPQWQTQVFLLQRDYDQRSGEDRRADLTGAAILMRALPGNNYTHFSDYGFSAGDDDFRLDEMARLALAKGRQVLSKRFRSDLLHGKYKNPMLGIYGAHLLLAEKELNKPLLKEVIGNLRRLLVLPHPDVEALALRLETEVRNDYVFDAPPMLRRSWAIVVEATANQSSLVSEDSLAGRTATRLWGPEPLLIWINRAADKANKDENEQEAAESLDDYEFILKERLKQLKQIPTAAASEREIQAEFGAKDEKHWGREFGGERHTAGEKAMNEAEAADFDFDRTADDAINFEEAEFDTATAWRETRHVDSDEITADFDAESETETILETERIAEDDLIREMVKSLGVPRMTVEKMLKRVQNAN